MYNYAFILGCNKKYLPGLNALLNSLDRIDNIYDVYVTDWEIPEEYKKAVEAAGFGFKVIWDTIEKKEIEWLGEAEVLMRKRYAMPYVLDYDAVCIMDADMMVFQDLTRYFKVASLTGLVLGNTLEQKRRYGHENHQYPAKSGNYIIDPEFLNDRDLACAPLFVGRDWYRALKESWDLVNEHPYESRFKAPDMDGLNICLLEAGSYEHTIPLSQHTWTGLHEAMIKAHTRAIELHGKPFTEDGEEINVVHGQFWNKIWQGWQVDAQMGMIDREFDGSESYKSRSRQSFETLCRWWKKCGVEHKINIKEYMEIDL